MTPITKHIAFLKRNNLRCLCCTFLISLLSTVGYPQGKEANIWYFGMGAGIDFNQGSPPTALTNSQMFIISGDFAGSATISDASGELLFYSDGKKIWNKDHQIMQNGNNMGNNSTQGAMIVPMPGSDHLYYFFNFDNNNLIHILQYSIIDINLDNGKGAVIEDIKNILLYSDVSYHLSAVKNYSNDEIWVLSHGDGNRNFYAFRITEDSLHTEPVISQAGSIVSHHAGYMKISPNGNKIALGTVSGNEFFEILDFNIDAGTVSSTQLVHKSGECNAVEFSPDNTKFYTIRNRLYQYDLEAGSPQQILDSEIQLSNEHFGEGALQLAPDGKLYCCEGGKYYLYVIHYPNRQGLACNFELNAVYLEGRGTSGGLPSFIQSYLNDPAFDTQNNCFGDATLFSIQETNGIDSVFWKFNDPPNAPHDTSTLFSPTYTFSHPDTFQVDLTVYSNLIQKTVTQEVVIHPLPQPDLGNDTLFCDTAFNLTLNPNCEGDFFNWSTGDFGTEEITVSDTGWYWVNVRLHGCNKQDSIYIGLFPAPQTDTANLVIQPAGCSYPTGSITGLQVSGAEPLSFFWLNQSGDTLATTLDIENLPAGIYSLYAHDGNGCTNLLGDYTVPDAGLPIDSVSLLHDHCEQMMGEIRVYVPEIQSPILYSIDSADSWHDNNGLFTGLGQGSYYIFVKDESECMGSYPHNPLLLQNIPAPDITSVTTTAETNYNQNGQIDIQAQSPAGSIYYSIDSGQNFQLDNGLFTGLSAGIYDCIVTDSFGCDTAFQVEVDRTFTDMLEAIAGGDSACLGDVVVSPLLLNNFTAVKSFDVKLTYDNAIVECQGYINLHEQLQDGFSAFINTTAGEIYLQWQGAEALTLENNSSMAELVFAATEDGSSAVDWSTGQGESEFLNQQGEVIDATYQTGTLRIYNTPKIEALAGRELCEGESIQVIPELSGGNGPRQYHWIGPAGFQSNDSILNQTQMQPYQSGTYTLSVEDSMHCKDQVDIEITVYPNPLIAFRDGDTLFMEQGDRLTAGEGYRSYLWNTGAITPFITIDSMGKYSVEVTSAQNCKSAASVYVLWSDQVFYLPNAFTPNGDGLNDFFKPTARYDYFQSYRLSIYNRWGELIFESESLSRGWDGSHNGRPAPQGTYVCRIDYIPTGASQTKTIAGTVVLLR